MVLTVFFFDAGTTDPDNINGRLDDSFEAIYSCLISDFSCQQNLFSTKSTMVPMGITHKNLLFW